MLCSMAWVSALLLLAPAAFAADGGSPTQDPVRANSVFVEVGGVAPFFSVNYERLVAEQWGGRLGIGYLPPISICSGCSLSDPGISAAVNAVLLLGNRTHSLELGLGVNAGFLLGRANDVRDVIAADAVIGYRYVGSSGLLFRASFTPFFMPWSTTGLKALPMGGLSLGLAF
jgi:hypothetical protein